MELSRKVVEARLNDLRAGYRHALEVRDQAVANVFASEGAIQDCEWFLSQFPVELSIMGDVEDAVPAS